MNYKSLDLKTLRSAIAVIFLFVLPSGLYAQDFMMQGWYWDYPKTAAGYNWADTLTNQANELGTNGFTYMWLPPLAKASSGSWSNGYDPRDLFDYGDFGSTGYGSRADLDQSVNALNANGVKVIADVVFNHRDGGAWENNPGLESYVDNFNWTSANNGDNPFPYDRMRNIIPIGGTTGLGAGTYYFKVSSASGHTRFENWEYKIYFHTNTVNAYQGSVNEVEPNGGGDCGQGSQTIALATDYLCQLDPVSGCAVDEFALTINPGDFDPTGDTIYIYWGNRNSGYSDARIYSIWYSSAAMDVVDNMRFQTMTDFSGMASGRGEMHWDAFKPNLDRATNLAGDWDGMYFYYDYDQFQQVTKDTLFEWAKWNWNDVGVRGFRMDAVKHFTPEFVGDLFDYLYDNGISPGVAVGEWYSTNPDELAGWVNNVYNYMDNDTKEAISPKIFDFALRESLRQACDQFGYDVRNVFGASLHDAKGLSGNNIITFVNNHDFRDNSGFASLIQNDPMLAYAYILTNNQLGLPSVFYPDYFGYPDDGTAYYPADKSAHNDDINELIDAHKNYIVGSSQVTYLNQSGSGYINDLADNSYVLVYQLNGTESGLGPDVVVAINFGGSGVQFHQQVKDIAVGTNLNDIFGHSAYNTATVQSIENGIPNDIWIDLPARSYAVWVEDIPQKEFYVPGTHNGWSFDAGSRAYLKDIGGNTDFYGSTFLANNGNEFKISEGIWDFDWGGGYNINVFDMKWTIGAGGGNAYWTLPGQRYIHLCIEDPESYHGTNIPVGIMRLSELPATIVDINPVVAHSAPSGTSATVGITLSDDAAPEEKVYVRYTDNSWTSDNIVQATGSGTSFTAILPSASAGTEREYYIFTSTAGLTNVQADPDHLTIHYDINGGDNYHYYVPSTSSDASLYFDGAGAHVKMNQVGDDQAPSMTIEAWIKPEASVSDFMPVLLRQLNLNGPQNYVQFGLGVNADNSIKFLYDDADGVRNNIETSSDVIRRDAWNHIAVRTTMGSGVIDISIFVNGFEEVAVTGQNPLYGGIENHDLYVGAAFLDENYFFEGAIDEVKMWKSSRTIVEIRDDMASYPEGNEANLMLYYAFEENAGTAIYDLSPNYYNGTLESFNGSAIPQFTVANLPAVWTGVDSEVWNNSGNWGWYGRLPVGDDDILITSWAANNPLMTGDLEIGELILNDHDIFNVAPGSVLKVTNGVYYKNTLRIRTYSPMWIHSGLRL